MLQYLYIERGLLEEIKKERKNFHNLTCHATVHQHMETAGVFIMPKIPEISVAVKCKIHFGFFCPEYLGLPSIGPPKFANPFLTNQFTVLLLLCKEFDKGIKIVRVRFLLVGAV